MLFGSMNTSPNKTIHRAACSLFDFFFLPQPLIKSNPMNVHNACDLLLYVNKRVKPVAGRARSCEQITSCVCGQSDPTRSMVKPSRRLAYLVGTHRCNWPRWPFLVKVGTYPVWRFCDAIWVFYWILVIIDRWLTGSEIWHWILILELHPQKVESYMISIWVEIIYADLCIPPRSINWCWSTSNPSNPGGQNCTSTVKGSAISFLKYWSRVLIFNIFF